MYFRKSNIRSHQLDVQEKNVSISQLYGIWQDYYGRQFEKILLQHGWEKVSNWECLFVHRQKGLFLSVYVYVIELAGKKQNINPMGAKVHFTSLMDICHLKNAELETKHQKYKERLNRLISYIHHTCEYRQYCLVGNTAKQCRLGLFQDSDFAGDIENSKSTSGGTLCIFGSHTFVPISWMCKKQTAVSHSSTESEIISLDTGLRLDGLPALEL